MQLIQVFVPREDQAAVRDRLDEIEAGHVFSDADGQREGALAYVPVPSGTTDRILEELHDAGLPEDTYRVVTDANQAHIPNVEDLETRFAAGPTGGRGDSHAELRKRAADLKPETATYVSFAIASALVAVSGLLLDSATIIVGAMVIAPFAGSALSASVGAVIGDREMVVDSATSQALGLVVAYLGAVGMSLLLEQTGFVPSTLVVARVGQVGSFSSPNLLTFAIAVSAGFAGALALATDLPVAIAGVAVAAAIVPAVGASGIGTVWGDHLVVVGALVLVLMNILIINLSAYVSLVLLGYRSSMIATLREDAALSLRSGAFAVVVVAFAVLLGLTGVATYQHIVFERAVNSEVEEVLGDQRYDSLELISVETSYSDRNLLADDPTVTVTVSRTSERQFDGLDQAIRTNVSAETGQPVTASVRFIDLATAEATGQRQDETGLWAWLRDLFDWPGVLGAPVTTPAS